MELFSLLVLNHACVCWQNYETPLILFLLTIIIIIIIIIIVVIIIIIILHYCFCDSQRLLKMEFVEFDTKTDE